MTNIPSKYLGSTINGNYTHREVNSTLNGGKIPVIQFRILHIPFFYLKPKD